MCARIFCIPQDCRLQCGPRLLRVLLSAPSLDASAWAALGQLWFVLRSTCFDRPGKASLWLMQGAKEVYFRDELYMHDYLTDTHSTFSQVNRIAHCSADMLPEVKRIDSKAYIFSLPQQIWPPLPIQVLISFRLTALPTRPQDMVNKVVQ